LTEQAKTRILVIDDEESIRYAVDAGLEFLGDYDVHFARDGKTGIEDKAFLPTFSSSTLSCRLSAG
jgi:CheY-like chemotaxis protein